MKNIVPSERFGQLMHMGRLLSLSWNSQWGFGPARKQLCTTCPSSSPASSPVGVTQPPIPHPRHSGAGILSAHRPGKPAPAPNNDSEPPQPSPKQQQHQAYHTVASSWQVRRTRIDHYPPQAQLRMRSEWKSRSAAAADAATPPPPAAAGPAGGQAAAVPPEVTAEAEQLLAALNWESSSGCQNGRGRSGERFSDWSASRLRQLAARLPEGPPGAAAGQGLVGTSPARLAATCLELAEELGGYESLDRAGRARLAQRARLAAEGLVSDAVRRFRQAQQQQQAQGPGVQQRGSRAAAAEPWGDAELMSAMAGAVTGIEVAALQPSGAMQVHPGMEEPPSTGPGRAQQLEQLPYLPPFEEVDAMSDDSAAALAHEEETAPPVSLGTSEGALQQGERLQLGRPPVAAALAAKPQPTQQAEAAAWGPAEQQEEQQSRRKREVSSTTRGFRQSFAQAAAAFKEASGGPGVSSLSGGEQRTAQWHKLRERRLTASAFSKALGFFDGDREGLWEEKVGLRAPFAGNAATAWGTRSEALALEDYQLHTGQAIEPCMFQVKHDDMAHGWLGASPDGLIGGLQVAPEAGLAGPLGMRGAGILAGGGPGILEVKCPYNKGRPEAAVPPKHAIWYYMPQVQGLMDIFDRDWCNLYVWTPRGGSGLYFIPRDRQYWAECFEVLADFWWRHVVPARQARERALCGGSPAGIGTLQRAPEGAEEGLSAQHSGSLKGGSADAGLEEYRPSAVSAATARLMAHSKELATAAPATFFPASAPGRR